jgi:predicted secreted protein
MSDNIELTRDDHSRRVALAPGATLEVRLAGQPGTGFSWQVTRCPANLKLLGTQNEGGGMPGGTSVQVFRFRAEGAATGELELGYRRVWEKDTPPAAQFRVTLTAPSG